MSDIVDLKMELAKKMARSRANLENQKYGEFIKQTNEVQLFLALFILKYSSLPDKTYANSLKRAELGSLVNLFQTCAPQTLESHKLLGALKKYNTNRIKLAHKMFSSEKLTLTECNNAISEGDAILNTLYKSAGIARRAF